jgi:hypothetical protein
LQETLNSLGTADRCGFRSHLLGAHAKRLP